MTRTARIAIIALAALAGAVSAYVVTRNAKAPPVLGTATLLDAPRPLPAMALVGQDGQPFDTSKLRGHWTLMFFGFANCPDICPTTLAVLAEAKRALADLPAASQPQVVLVSVDPGRDTPEQLARYVAHFDPSFLGATGSPEAIEALTRELGVAVMIGAPGADGSYSVDHSAAVFLIDPDAAYVAVFGTPHAADAIARDFRAILDAR